MHEKTHGRHRKTIKKIPAKQIENVKLMPITQAAETTGLSEFRIRQTGISQRRIGNTDYIDPHAVNAWIDSNPDKSSPGIESSI